MEHLKNMLLEEIDSFRELGHRFENKEVSSADFKATSGGMGVYAHRGGEEFMIRLRIPSGILNTEELKLVYNLAKDKNLDSVHTTTRQAIQLHGLSIDEICDVMKEAMNNGIYTRGGGGNFPRNVSISPLSGVDKEEVFDVTPYAQAVNNHFMNKITTYKLPRKLKVSFSSSDKDTGNAGIADLGFMATKKDGKDYFKVYLTGGLGKNAAKAIEFDELIETKDVLYHVEAITNFFMAEGDYLNKNKARSRYITARMGEESALECYKKHLAEVKVKNNLDLEVTPKEYNKSGVKINLNNNRLIEQKQEGLYTVYFHPIGGILKLDTLKLILDRIENVEDVEIRLSMSEGMYIRNLNGDEAKDLLEITKNLGGETKLEQSSACIGVPICQIGIAKSQSLLDEILSYFNEKGFNKDVLPSLRISGCNNSCGTHQIGLLGFAGKKKRINDVVTEAFEIHMNGKLGKDDAKLGSAVGDIARDDIPKFLYELAVKVDALGITYDEFIVNQTSDFNEIINKYLV
ncbi:nitrite/sulfite reductase [Romboutsia ilealis]|uniref:Nitrite/sulfite reductase n=1 Tax=Romboutsia faecis TaxID=2764597 RepID=A0ABR7JRS9_9FIRM|nr:nitrite/sulfite reductase [Romboutsia faecis]MBC5997589.1 nitrite/sulfite reductase [Romboutsia faecis]MRN24778.1 nitrite/sulfite reductase [Romboutsia ilealis]